MDNLPKNQALTKPPIYGVLQDNTEYGLKAKARAANIRLFCIQKVGHIYRGYYNIKY
jgi:hypothetical protein